MTSLDRLAEIVAGIKHGPCFPLRVTDRFGTNRIEDAHGNVVIEQPDIWLPEAAEFLVTVGNVASELIAVARAAENYSWHIAAGIREVRARQLGELQTALAALDAALAKELK